MAPGCTNVSNTTHEEHIAGLDEDGDGVTRADRDCDDRDETRYPGAVEAPYDGVDANCDGFDTVDMDGDGFPAMTRAEYLTAFGQGAPWPDGLRDTEADCADDPAVVPQAASVFPGNPDETPYDGLDSDCDGANDFDQDGDGTMPDGVEEPFAAYVEAFGLDFPATFGDCDDTDAQAYPGSGADTLYDGSDGDCAGDNDFDGDGDGYMPDEAVNRTAFQAFLQRYHGGHPPEGWGVVRWGDCLDGPHPDLPAADPAAVHPGATETWYDGVDGDCDRGNDYDRDSDRWIRNGDLNAMREYDTHWGYHHEAGVGDCDDTDAEANPARIEVLGDGADLDCDGGEHTARFRFAEVVWTDPRPPRVIATDTHFVVASAASEVDLGAPTGVLAQAGIAVAVPHAPEVDEAHTGEVVVWHGLEDVGPIGRAIDLVPLGDGWAAAVAYTHPNPTDSYVASVRYAHNPGGNGYDRGVVEIGELIGVPFESVDLDLAIDGGDKPWLWSCGQTDLQATLGTGDPGVSASAHLGGLPSVTCFVEPPQRRQESVVTVCDGNGCQSVVYDGEQILPAEVQPRAGQAIRFGDHRDDYLLYADDEGVWIDDNLGAVRIREGLVDAADVAWVDGQVFLLAAVTVGRTHELVLAWGDPLALPLEERTFTFESAAGEPLDPTGVGIAADETTIVLAVAGRSGAVDDLGWMVLAR